MALFESLIKNDGSLFVSDEKERSSVWVVMGHIITQCHDREIDGEGQWGVCE